jgi:hypothetical protein
MPIRDLNNDEILYNSKDMHFRKPVLFFVAVQQPALQGIGMPNTLFIYVIHLYLTTQTLYKRQTSLPPVGFESTIPASARPQTYALDRAATGIGKKGFVLSLIHDKMP